MSFAALARVAGIEPASFGFGGRRSSSLNFTLISKTNKNPDLGRGLVLIARLHSDPQDTTPQITRLPVILTMSRLKVLSIMSIRQFTIRTFEKLSYSLWSVRQDSNLRALRS